MKHIVSKWYALTNYYAILINLYTFYRGTSFRKEFAHLNEVRSIIPQNIRLMALTATATIATRKFVINNNLGMQHPAVVYVPPIKEL